MQKHLTNSDTETKEVASKLAREFKNKNAIFSLTGELGAGKTTFVQGFAQGLGIKDKIISPTFVLIRQHQIPDTQKILYHLDLYRLEGQISLESLGLDDLVTENPENLVLIEWADKISSKLPKNTIKISIEKTSESQRIIAITEESSKSQL